MKRETSLIQHPMYLLIREDTTCAERTPPWGEPTIELYIERIRSNLARLREAPQIKIGFEWSALELELLAQDAPDVFAEMCELAKDGRVQFYNGTYSQPHLQVQSSESNIRQFELGSRVYRELCGQNVVTYAHQETSIHDQMPQILDAFGYQYSALPHFPSNLLYINGGEILLRLGEPHFLHTQEFVRWVGLDGTELPLYLTPRRYPIQEWITRETAAGLMSGPTLRIENPDLLNVTADWLEERKGVEMVLLDDAFRERIAQTPPQVRARHFTYWSYVEGIRAEQVSRENWIAEKSVLQLEALNAMAYILLGSTPDNTDALWKRILASQHHDAACFCAPELRGKAIGWLEEVRRAATEMSHRAAGTIAAQVDTGNGQGIPLVVFHGLPHEQQQLVTVQVPAAHQRLLDNSGALVPVKPGTAQSGEVPLQFVAQSKCFGYETYWLEPGTVEIQETRLEKSFTFQNPFYRATIAPDGTFVSLQILPAGAELLSQETRGGNFLRATDSAGISPALNPGLTNKPKWEIPEAPPELQWQSTAPMHLRATPLGATLTVTGKMGNAVDVSLCIDMYHALARIDIAHTFTFRDASIGIFYLDDTKLRAGWQVGFRGEIHHDIPFGIVKTGENLPILASSWVDISDGAKGLAFLHRGTFKHWVSDNTLTNLFAWGEVTNAIGDRIYRENWAKSFDQRLNGVHTIRTAVYPHTGDWRTGAVSSAAAGYNTALHGALTTRHLGPLPIGMNLIGLGEPELVPTSIRVQDSKVTCRAYSIAEQTLVPTLELSQLALSSVESLNGEPVSQIAPCRIAVMRLIPTSASP